MKMRCLCAVALCLLSGMVWAASWISSVEVVQIGTYQHASTHFVWFSASSPECQGVLSFNHDAPGGKALFATLTTALISKRKVDVQVNGCDIVEVYLK